MLEITIDFLVFLLVLQVARCILFYFFFSFARMLACTMSSSIL
jgi:hypothetical protein